MISRTLLSSSRLIARRGLATAAAKNSTPPVQLFGLDGTYASALYTASVKSSSIETTEKSLSSLKALLTKDPKIEDILSNPSLSASDKKFVIDTVAKAANADATVVNLLKVLGQNNRLNLIPNIVAKFETLTNAYKGLIEATVTSAQPLDSKILNRLQAAITKSEFVGQGKKLKLDNKVNPDILGGLIVEVGDRTVDLSVSSKISKLNQLLSESV